MNKSLKAAISFALALVMLLTLISSPAQANERDVACSAGGGTFKIVGTIVTSSTGNCGGDIVIPADVTELANSAFNFRLNLKNVTFEAGSQLKKIGNNAFNNVPLTSIDLPDGLETIDAEVFANSSKLKSLSIPGTVKSIGARISFDGSLETLTFEPRVATTLSLDEQLIVRNRNFIGPITFMGPGPTVTPEFTPWGRTGYQWGGWATSEGGSRVTFPRAMGSADSVLYPLWIPDTVTVHNCGTSGTFEVRNGVAGGASSSCVGDVVIPASAHTVAGFAGRKISNVTFEPGSQLKKIGDYAFDSSTLSSIDLPDGLETIVYWGFKNTKLKSLSIPGSVKTITQAGLSGNSLLESVVFESRIEGAGRLSIDTLEQNQKLKSLTFMGDTLLSGNPTVPKAVNTWLGWSTSEGGPIVAFPSSVVAGTTLFTNHSPKTYTVTFDSRGGSAVAPGTIVGGEFQQPTPPTREGYTFWKWVMFDWDPGPGDVGVTYHYSDSNLNLMAAYKENIYVVNYVPNGGPAVAPGSFKTGGVLFVANPTRPGYNFAGWSLTDGGGWIGTNSMYTPGVTKDITLYGKWTPDAYNVYFEAPGVPIPQTRFVTDGTIEQAPVPAPRVGYRFDGFQMTTTGGYPTNKSDPVISFPYTPGVMREIWMWAKWTRLFEVTYKNMGADVTREFFGEGEIINAAPVLPLRAGYTLSWSKTGDGAEVVSFPHTPDVFGNITLYAKWTPNLNSIFFNSNRGTPVADGSFFTDSTVMEPPVAPTRRGYTFDNWSATEGGAAILFPYFSGATSDITLFAKWTANTYRVNHDSKNGAPVVDAGSYQTDGEIASAPATPEARLGYTFLGWSATDGGSVVSFPYAPDDIGDITISAVWDAHTHSVNLNPKGGSSVPAVSFKTDAAVRSAPATPIRAGYTLLGWSATDGGSVVSFPYAPGVIGDITLYAVWDANTHSVNLILNGGSSVPAVSFKTDAAITSAPATPIRAGYTFDGWSATESGSLITFPYTPGVIEGITLYSKWTRDPYKPELLENATVSGDGYQSTNMEADFGSWSAYPDATISAQWYRCEKAVSSGLSRIPASSKCVKIAGATKSNYKLVVADAGEYMTVLVQAKNSIGTTLITAKSDRALPLKAPAKVKLPAVEGTAVAKQTLTVDDGTWEANPVAKTSIQWFRCEDGTKVSGLQVPKSAECEEIKGAKGTRYRLVTADEGKYITAQIEAENSEGAAFTTAKSVRVALTPSVIANPDISGSAQIGKVVSASDGRWLAFPAADTSVQWFRCNKETLAGAKKFGGSSGCVAIKGATKSRYTVAAADRGKHISALVTAENKAGDESVTTDSQQVSFEPTNTTDPRISGTATVGRTLEASSGGWTAFPEENISFAWYRCANPTVAGSESFALASGCVPIGGANDSSYTLAGADGGKHISVLVKARNSAGSNTVTARSTAEVTQEPTKTANPSISGSATVGRTLNATPGGWTAFPEERSSFTWYRCENPTSAGSESFDRASGCVAIGGATQIRYTVKEADKDKYLSVLVKASNSAGSSSATARSTAKVN